MMITIFSKIFGFMRDITLSYFYGASSISDAYLISLAIPMSVIDFIGTGIATGYIPIYSKIEKRLGTEEGLSYNSNLITIIIGICTVILFIAIIFTNPIIKLFASGFDDETLALTAQFTKISIFGIFFTATSYVLRGFLQFKGKHVISALIGFPLNIVFILSIFLSSKFNILLLPLGSVIASIFQLSLLLCFAYRQGYKYEYILDFKDKYVKDMLYLAFPVIIGVSVNQINLLVDRSIASNIVEGGISALSYAHKLNDFVQGIFVISIVTVVYPLISKMIVEENINGFKKAIMEAINSICIFVVPATVGTMVFAEPIILLLFGRGAFDRQAMSLTSSALFYYSIGMIGFGLREVLARGFYSLQDTKTPMINATIAVLMNIVLNFVLSKYMGIAGLALATSISAIFCTGLLFMGLRKKVGPFGIKNVVVSFIKILIASLMMGVLVKLLYYYLTMNMSVIVSLTLCIGIGAIIYFMSIYFLKIDEVDNIVRAVKRKLKRA